LHDHESDIIQGIPLTIAVGENFVEGQFGGLVSDGFPGSGDPVNHKTKDRKVIISHKSQ
jgi:hypothetical protein